MKKICIVTGTRAEYGILKLLISALSHDPTIDLRIVATGTHLSPDFGNTYKAIEADGFNIDRKVEMLLNSDSKSAISKSMGIAMLGFSDYFEERHPDLVVLLGDRYEIFAVATCAAVALIPIAHLHGGEATFGLYDEYFRHSITKMSTLHFTCCEVYRNRVIQLGEHPDTVFNVGALGVEHIKKIQLLTKHELEQSIGFSLDKPYGLVTFHPVTLDERDSTHYFQEMLEAMDKIDDMVFILTKANADDSGRAINRLIDAYVRKNGQKAIAFESLGQLRYLSAMNYCEFVLGNTSSGILEAPSMKVPTVNIGDRQAGRVRAKSVIDCEPTVQSIYDAILRARSKEMKKICKDVISPFEGQNTSLQICEIIKQYLNSEKHLAKQFYDLNKNA